MKTPNLSSRTKAFLVGCLALLIVAVLPAGAANVTWTGSNSTAWADDANWDGTAPGNNTVTDIAVFNLASYGGDPPFAPNAGTRDINGIQFGQTGALTLNGTSLSIGSGGISSIGTNTVGILINSNIVLAANQTWEHASNSRMGLTVNGVVSGTAIELTIAGRPDYVSGQWTINGNNTYSGTTIIEAGNIRINHVNGLGTSSVSVANGAQLFLAASGQPTFTNNITLNGGSGYPVNGERVALRVGAIMGGTLTLADATDSTVGNNSNSATISGQITGSGALTVGAGQMSGNTGASNALTLLNTSNNWTGGLTIHGDYITANLTLRAQRFQTLALGASGVIPDTNSITFGESVDETPTNSRLNLNGFNETVDLISSFQDGYGIIFNGLDASTANLTIGGGNATSATFSGVIRNDNPALAGTGIVGLTKIGNGTQILGGANTYTGATTVNAGTLLINGSLAAGSAVTVNDGVIGGNGTINGSVLINADGTVAPGNSPGTLTMDNGLTINGTYAWEIDANSTASGFDSINLTDGELVLNGGSVFDITALSGVDFANAFWTSSQQWTVINNTGTGSLTGTFGSLTGLTSNAYGSFSLDYVSGVGGDVFVEWTPIPEPSAIALVGLGLSALLFRRTSRRRNP